MIDVYDMYLSFSSAVNTFAFGWYRPNTDFIRRANDFSNEIWEIETRRAEKSQEARDNLMPFLKTTQIVVAKQNSYYGIAKVPDDYGRFASGRIIEGGKDTDCNDPSISDDERTNDYYDTTSEGTIQLVDEQRWGACLKHITKKPTLESPKMNQSNGSFRIAPREVSNLVLAYYTRPVPAFFAYTITLGDPITGQGDQLIYNKKQSRQFQWPSTMINEFVWRLGESYAYFTRDQFLAAGMDKNKKEV